MSDTPTTGSVRVILKLDTEDAKRRVAEVEKHLRKTELDRRIVVQGIDREGIGAKTGGPRTGRSIADKILSKALPSPGGFNPKLATNPLAQMAQQATQWAPIGGRGFLGAARALGNFVNPFPKGGISGSNVAGGLGSTLALAGTLYEGAKSATRNGALGLAYGMRSGAASIQTPAGQALNEGNRFFEYIDRFFVTPFDAAKKLAAWDDTVAAVTGKLPDTQFYFPKFNRMAAFERDFADMMQRNAALTKAGAMGASSIVDQIDDTFAQGMSR